MDMVSPGLAGVRLERVDRNDPLSQFLSGKIVDQAPGLEKVEHSLKGADIARQVAAALGEGDGLAGVFAKLGNEKLPGLLEKRSRVDSDMSIS